MTIERTSDNLGAEAYEQNLDALVDKMNTSYHLARESLGAPPYELYGEDQEGDAETQTASAVYAQRGRRGRRRGTAHIGAQYGEDTTLIIRPGEVLAPAYYDPYEALSKDQIERNKRGLDLARKALRGE